MSTLVDQDWLLAIFRKKMLTPTGKQEFLPLDCIDSALADALNDAFTPLVVSVPDRTNKSFCEFLKRSPRDRITLGTFSSVDAWLAAFESSRSGRKDSACPPGKVNKLAMPLINLSRSPAFSVYEGELSRDVFDDGQISDQNGTTTALVATMPVSLDYTLWIASDEKESLNMVATALAFWLRFYASRGQASFTATSEIAGADMCVECVINGQKSIAFEDLAPGTEENRLFAVGLDLNVIVDLPLLSYVNQTDARISVKARVQRGGDPA